MTFLRKIITRCLLFLFIINATPTHTKAKKWYKTAKEKKKEKRDTFILYAGVVTVFVVAAGLTYMYFFPFKFPFGPPDTEVEKKRVSLLQHEDLEVVSILEQVNKLNDREGSLSPMNEEPSTWSVEELDNLPPIPLRRDGIGGSTAKSST